ncbi:inversin-like isoform X2 [Ornithodoros turicata]|uniref:inversin-like isoform X2 n=1 Tax=Ornithodoros turicata TaxID=34597 RepID=UPI0031395608
MNDSVTRFHICALQGNKAELRKMLCNPSLLEAKDHIGRTLLFYSVMGNNEQCLSLLLKSGARVDNGDNDGQTPLHLASHKGLKGCMKFLLAAGAVWHQKDIRGVTALHLAAHNPNSKALALILDFVPPGQLDLQDACKRTALHFSASFCIPENVRMLLKQDANALIQDENGQTPLHMCASRNDIGALECARVLLERCPSLINWQDYEGQTALHLAVAQGLEDMVDFLTSRPLCDLNLVDNLFRTPLHWAAALGMPAMAELLLDRRADPLCADGKGATPLHYAAQQNDISTVMVLLLRGCSGEMSDQKALHHGAAKGHNGVVELLLDLGCQVNVPDGEGMTPLAFACKEGNAHTLPLLLDACASLRDSDICGRTPLHWAAKENHACICQLLIKHGYHVNIRDNYGMTPLHYASLEGHLSCMLVLLENGADPNVLEHQGKTALHLASKAGHSNVVELLYSHQAKVNCMDVDRLTALDYTISGGHSQIIQFLLSRGTFTSNAIREIAACVLQSFFKEHFWHIKAAFVSTNSKSAKHKDLFLTEGKKDARRETGSQTISEQHVALCVEHTRDVAALRIQRAWRRYTVGQMQLRAQERVLRLFESQEQRQQAQQEWNCFMDKLQRLGFQV